jgi:hypothetical protein
MRHRSILLHGLRLVITVPGALLWTYAVNLLIAFVFSLKLHAQLSSILDHSLAAERLNAAFDLGTLGAVSHRLTYMAPSVGETNYLGLPLYLLCYFILGPGALFSFQSHAPSRLSILVSSGISFFWRFVRISMLTALVSGLILAPLIVAQLAWSQHVNTYFVEESALLHKLPGILLIVLVAALLRLYFDLVEVYTVQLADRYRPTGKPDRRIRRTLLPALHTLRQNFGRAYLTFVSLTVLGFAAVAFTGSIAMHMLAQPRVWPMFLLAQAGLFAMMATRFWQRGAETILCCDNPLPFSEPEIAPYYPGHHIHYSAPSIRPPASAPANDAQPDPEPAPPFLSEPDPGVFHHETGKSEEGREKTND